jgi:hypothetical protein
MQMRRGTAVTDMYARRRRVQQIGEAPIRRIRCEPRCRTRREDDQAEQHGSGDPHASISSRTARISDGEQEISEQRAEREKACPAAAHADTR